MSTFLIVPTASVGGEVTGERWRNEATSWYFPGLDAFVGQQGCDGAGLALEDAGEITVRVRGVAADGRVGEWSEPATVEIPACGCGLTSTASPWAALLALSLALRRRPVGGRPPRL